MHIVQPEREQQSAVLSNRPVRQQTKPGAPRVGQTGHLVACIVRPQSADHTCQLARQQPCRRVSIKQQRRPSGDRLAQGVARVAQQVHGRPLSGKGQLRLCARTLGSVLSGCAAKQQPARAPAQQRRRDDHAQRHVQIVRTSDAQHSASRLTECHHRTRAGTGDQTEYHRNAHKPTFAGCKHQRNHTDPGGQLAQAVLQKGGRRQNGAHGIGCAHHRTDEQTHPRDKDPSNPRGGKQEQIVHCKIDRCKHIEINDHAVPPCSLS